MILLIHTNLPYPEKDKRKAHEDEGNERASARGKKGVRDEGQTGTRVKRH